MLCYKGSWRVPLHPFKAFYSSRGFMWSLTNAVKWCHLTRSRLELWSWKEASLPNLCCPLLISAGGHVSHYYHYAPEWPPECWRSSSILGDVGFGFWQGRRKLGIKKKRSCILIFFFLALSLKVLIGCLLSTPLGNVCKIIILFMENGLNFV